jgi:hypothetical protein
MLAIEKGELGAMPAPKFADGTALGVVMAANGYPGTPETGGAIGGIEAAEAAGARVFQAGTKLDGKQLVASGGRVLTVIGTGASVGEAQPPPIAVWTRSISRPASAAAISAGAKWNAKPPEKRPETGRLFRDSAPAGHDPSRDCTKVTHSLRESP